MKSFLFASLVASAFTTAAYGSNLAELPKINNVTLKIAEKKPCPPNMLCAAVEPPLVVTFSYTSGEEIPFSAEVVDMVVNNKATKQISISYPEYFMNSMAIPEEREYQLEVDGTYQSAVDYIIKNPIGW